MKSKKLKFLCMILALVMVFTSVPAWAISNEREAFPVNEFPVSEFIIGEYLVPREGAMFDIDELLAQLEVPASFGPNARTIERESRVLTDADIAVFESAFEPEVLEGPFVVSQDWLIDIETFDVSSLPFRADADEFAMRRLEHQAYLESQALFENQTTADAVAQSWNIITLSYVGNGHTGGVVPSSQSFWTPGNATLAFPGSMTRAGHTFGGWLTAQGQLLPGGAQLHFPAGSLGTLMFWAHWIPVQNQVLVIQYHGNGHTGGSPPPADFINTPMHWTFWFPTHVNMTRAGHTFGGWQDVHGNAVSGVHITQPFSGTIHLFAIWVPAMTSPIIRNPSFDWQQFNASDLSVWWDATHGAAYTFSLVNVNTGQWIYNSMWLWTNSFTIPRSVFAQGNNQYLIVVNAMLNGVTKSEVRWFLMNGGSPPAIRVNMSQSLFNMFADPNFEPAFDPCDTILNGFGFNSFSIDSFDSSVDSTDSSINAVISGSILVYTGGVWVTKTVAWLSTPEGKRAVMDAATIVVAGVAAIGAVATGQATRAWEWVRGRSPGQVRRALERIARASTTIGTCIQTAKDMATDLRRRNVNFHFVEIQFDGNVYVMSRTRGLLQDLAIGRFGYHIGVLHSGLVHCNIHPGGKILNSWINDFESTMLSRYIVVSAEHRNFIGQGFTRFREHTDPILIPSNFPQIFYNFRI